MRFYFNVFFFIQSWLWLLVFVCGDIELNPIRGILQEVLFANICGLDANLAESAVTISE